MINFFLNTRIGQALILVAIILLCWWGFSAHYKGVGYDQCNADRDAAAAKATVALYDAQVERDKRSSAATKEANAAGQAVVKDAERDTTEATTEIRYVYLKPPATAPVASCVELHPVDPGVQRAISGAVDQANAAAR